MRNAYFGFATISNEKVKPLNIDSILTPFAHFLVDSVHNDFTYLFFEEIVFTTPPMRNAYFVLQMFQMDKN